ncbi:hypothetical protein [Lactiplantibacillus plantarum]|uniref:hypothetical protein n=1 Tax=Lactiplantibacillus plantarum TaxID=1590 RepID=UPI000717A1C7|nr:hypothetical protein [Lactiplantibacillus plantarum]KRU20051.1 hypothetical protein ASU25_04830 [Lactiplantibacillus plantarum]CAB1719562.1 hypothetical protein LAP9491_00420 [Lactiplantibacillus plantarum]
MLSIRFKRILTSVQAKPIINVLIILVLAFVSSYPAFTGHFFALSNDGAIHLARLESLYQAFKVGRLPSLVNFIGFNNSGVAMNAMYPWLTMMIYVIPRLLIQGPMLALALGFFIMNTITITNSYLLAKYLGHSRLITLLGLITYQFNAYHFQLMYTRVAIGEAFGYAFLPLVILGLFKIWNREKSGIFWLSIGMSLVANSHVLSLMMFTILVGILETIRLFSRKMDLNELKYLMLSVGLTILMSLYSLFNVIDWILHNKMVSPTPALIGLDPNHEFSRILSNDITESATGAHMGIAITFILIYLLAQLLSKTTGSWRYWAIGAGSIFILAQNWLPTYKLINTPATLIQFTMRFLTIVAMGTTIALILYLNHNNWHMPATAIFISLFVIIIGLTGVIQFHSQNKSNYLWSLAHHHSSFIVNQFQIRHLTSKNYYKNVQRMDVPDYHLKNPNVERAIKHALKRDLNFKNSNRLNKKTVAFDHKSRAKFKFISANDQQVSFKLHQSHTKALKLPVIGYKNVNYQIKVNNHLVKYAHSQGQLKANLPAGHSKITVSIANNSRHGWALFITLFAYIASLLIFSSHWRIGARH